MNTLEISPVIQPKIMTNRFSFKVEYLTYTFNSSGAIACSGPWNPYYCFPRKLICFQGHLFSVTRLFCGDPGDCEVQSIIIPSSIQIIGANCFGPDPCESLELVAFEPGSQLTDLRADAFRGCLYQLSVYAPAVSVNAAVLRISDLNQARRLIQLGNKRFLIVGHSNG
jgi:hypothetical protein